MAVPSGYKKLPSGVRCRCIRLWRDPDGSHWCCKTIAGCVDQNAGNEALKMTECPVCHGRGKLPAPHLARETDAQRKIAWAKALRNAGYSMRQIAFFVGWKSVNSVTKALKD